MNGTASARRILRNLGSLSSGRVLGDLATYVLFVTLSRQFGEEGIGKYSLAMALTGFLGVAADFGLYTFSVKYLARRPGPLGVSYGVLLRLRLLLSAVALALLLVLYAVLPLPADTLRILLLIGLFQISFSMLEGFMAVFVASEQMHVAAALELGTRLVTAAVGVGVIVAGGGLIAAVSALPAVSLVAALVGWVLVWRRHGRPRPFGDRVAAAGTLRQLMPFGLASLLRQTSTRLDVLFVGFLLGEAAAGTYNVAYRLVFPLLFLPHFVGLTLFPSASRMYLRERERLVQRYRLSVNLMVLIGLPAAAGLWLISGELIALIYGPGFEHSAPILQLLAWLLLLTLIKGVLGVYLMSCDRQTLWTKGWAVSAAVNLVGNALLIPWLGIAGAAVATLLSEAALLLLALYWLRPVLGWPRVGSRLLIAGMGSAAFCLVFTRLVQVPLAVAVPGSVLIYAATILAFPAIRRDELRLLRELVGERGHAAVAEADGEEPLP